MSTGAPPERTSLMSAIIRFGRVSETDDDGVESQSSARAGSFGSTHRYISCGFASVPARDLGTQLKMKVGWTGSERSKNFSSNGNVVSLPVGQAWMTELQRNVITMSSFFCGHTRSSRVVIPTCAACGAPISLTTVGLDGSATSKTRMPGCACGQFCVR